MAKGGGAWKVAYADFVTAMMAFFMVMWLVNQKPEVRQAIAEHFRNPDGPRMSGRPESSMLPSDEKGSGGRKRKLTSHDPAVSETRMTDEGSHTNVGSVLRFAANSTAISDDAKAAIDAIVGDLQSTPRRIEIRAHPLQDRIGGMQSRIDGWQVSFQRAIATMAYLVSQGVAPERIRLSQAGYDELPEHLADPNNATAAVEIFLLGDAKIH